MLVRDEFPRSSTVTLEVADLMAIDGLIADYLFAIDERNLALFAELWTRDARFDLARDAVGLGTPLRGREAIVIGFTAFFAREDAKPSDDFTRHLAAHSSVEVSDGQVRGKTAMLSVAQPRGAGSAGLCRVSRTGIYYDRFEREGGKWRFAERLLAWDPPGP